MDEIKQLYREGGKSYFKSFWNYIDDAGQILILLILPLHLVRSQHQWIPAIPGNIFHTTLHYSFVNVANNSCFFLKTKAVIVIWVKLLFYARGSPTMGPFVRMLVQIGVFLFFL